MAFLLDDILLFPVKGVIWVGKKIHEMAMEELEDTPEKLKRELLDLQMALEVEQITESEYQKKEVDILERLGTLEEKKQGRTPVV